MPRSITTIDKIIEKIALHVITLEPGDLPVLGKLIKDTQTLEGLVRQSGHTLFSDLIQALHIHLEKLIFDGSSDFLLLEDGQVGEGSG
ncbi:MAG: hypothetical protein JW932_19625 [Deltaproteobacteria bacterium]|nr:hypothetical protein [Deltaproteobacteria bacterium]